LEWDVFGTVIGKLKCWRSVLNASWGRGIRMSVACIDTSWNVHDCELWLYLGYRMNKHLLYILYSYQRYQFNAFDTSVETRQKYVIVIVLCLTSCMLLIITVILLLYFVSISNLVLLLLHLCYAAVLVERFLKIGNQSVLIMIFRCWYLWNVVCTDAVETLLSCGIKLFIFFRFIMELAVLWVCEQASSWLC
jgi:hypothetical protein